MYLDRNAKTQLKQEKKRKALSTEKLKIFSYHKRTSKSDYKTAGNSWKRNHQNVAQSILLKESALHKGKKINLVSSINDKNPATRKAHSCERKKQRFSAKSIQSII